MDQRVIDHAITSMVGSAGARTLGREIHTMLIAEARVETERSSRYLVHD